jgi:hypothetical protein
LKVHAADLGRGLLTETVKRPEDSPNHAAKAA